MPKRNIYSIVLVFVVILSFLSVKLFLVKNPPILSSSIPEMLSRHLPINFKSIEACHSSDGLHFEKRDTVGNFWGGSSGFLLSDGVIVLGGLDFSDRSGITDKQTGYSIKDIGFLQSRDGWNFSKFKPEINDLDRNITACGDPVLVGLPEGGYRMYFSTRDLKLKYLLAFNFR